jgi:isopenicillin N synthase-like dioxygenase
MNTLSYEIVSLTQEDLLRRGSALTEKMSRALHEGIFYVEIPEELKTHVNAGKIFAENLRERKEELSTFNTEPYMGYQERYGTQAVAFVTKQAVWKKAFSDELHLLASRMNEISLQILKEALTHLAIPNEMWNQATGGLTQGQGTIILTMNNYQPGPESKGLPAHADVGWITLLFINQAGLRAFIEGQWREIAPKEGFFVGNFGRAFELLVNDPKKLPACIHEVDKLFQKRISFGLFLNHQEGTHMCQLGSDGKLFQKQTYEEYLQARFAEFTEMQKQGMLQSQHAK